MNAIQNKPLINEKLIMWYKVTNLFSKDSTTVSQGVVLSQADDSVSSSVSSSPFWAHGGMETDATISDETYEIFKNIIIAH